eukprot:6599093-Lingulodinium_polyedra.AAC.1
MPVRQATVMKSLGNIGQANEHADARADLQEVSAYLKQHAAETVQVRRMIRHGQLAALAGTAPSWEEKK